MPRDEKFVRKYTELWEAGVTTSEMGLKLGMSKNAVCGLRKRLHLDARPTPIRRDPLVPSGAEATPTNLAEPKRLGRPPGPPRPRAPKAMEPKTEPGPWLAWFNRLNREQRQLIAAAPHEAACPLCSGGALWACLCGASLPGSPLLVSRAPAPPRPVVPVATVAAAATPATAPRPAPQCCWPLGGPGKFTSCDDPATPGKPYCAEHCKLAYVRVRDRRQDAAD